MTQATYYLYRQTVLRPSIKIWEMLGKLMHILLPRKIVAIGWLMILMSLMIPISIIAGIAPLSFGLLFLAMIGIAGGALACMVGCTFYVGGNQALY
ncbi:MAG: hypothetical protein JSV61_07835 [Anaerolineales bacterium]|nr:MAG: hypothetical protein JSV61_07835 [Anaerolineales bacterium]